MGNSLTFRIGIILVLIFAFHSTSKAKNNYASTEKTQYSRISLKTNLPYYLALMPNLEVEYHFNPRWSANLEGGIAWWSHQKKHKYYQMVQVSPEVRYHFPSSNVRKGHYIGTFLGAGYYDLANGEDGFKGEFGMGGLSYGYKLPVNRNLSFDFGIGVGVLITEYEEYIPLEGHYVYQQTSRTTFVGPLKLKIAIAWHWPLKPNRKGGNR